MCLGIPGKIVRVFDDNGLRMGDVDFGGVTRRICVAYLPDAVPGDYAVVHAGFAISRIDPEAAERTLKLLAALGDTLEPEDER
jgi:hydrogenase expression/formation protein HypC